MKTLIQVLFSLSQIEQMKRQFRNENSDKGITCLKYLLSDNDIMWDSKIFNVIYQEFVEEITNGTI